MPKKDGIVKTYSFSFDTVSKLNVLCERERRTQTNYLEKLIFDKYAELENHKESD